MVEKVCSFRVGVRPDNSRLRPQRRTWHSEDLALLQRSSIDTPLMDLVDNLETPVFVYDERRLGELLNVALIAKEKASFELLYAVKASAYSEVLEFLGPRIDGFSVSSLFEARFIRSLFPDGQIHYTSPGLRASEVSEIGNICDFVSFNSSSQLERFGVELSKSTSVGIRVNTRISSVLDPMYDPCRVGSKLGIPVEQLKSVLKSTAVNIEGVHIHTNADSVDFGQLLTNVDVLMKAIPDSPRLSWVNLGGGYLFEDAVTMNPLTDSTAKLRQRFDLQIFVEPGSGLVRSAGYLVSSVVDLFEVDGAQIAVLDTSVNHMPEVLEFRYRPDVMGQSDDGRFQYTLAGCTCLAGDLFGSYKFDSPLELGSKVIIEEAGSYTIAKAHRFNGVNLPSIAVIDTDGCCKIRKSSTYENFVNQWTSNE